jgi:hypothetical protein
MAIQMSRMAGEFANRLIAQQHCGTVPSMCKSWGFIFLDFSAVSEPNPWE